MLGEVDQFRDEAEIKSYHTIDIDIPEDKPKEKTETKEKKEASQTPRSSVSEYRKTASQGGCKSFPCIVPMNREIFSMSRQADFPRL